MTEARLEKMLTSVLVHIQSLAGRYPAEVAIPGGFHLPVWRMRGPIQPDATVREYDIRISEIRDSNGMWAYKLDMDDETGVMFDPAVFAWKGYVL